MNRPNCKKCHAKLTKPVVYYEDEPHAICPNCGKLWRLNYTHTAIYNVSLDVQSGKHGTISKF